MATKTPNKQLRIARRASASIAVLLLACYSSLSFAAAASRPICLGRAATIVGKTAIIYGTSADDVIVGTGGRNVIYGRGGNDRICAGGGADTVYGGSGSDKIDGFGAASGLDGADTRYSFWSGRP